MIIMKILAIETELKKLNENSDKEILKQEAQAVLELQQKGGFIQFEIKELHPYTGFSRLVG